MARQYERLDCVEEANSGLEYEVGTSLITTNMGGDVDLVFCFGNPLTQKVVWIPYESRIEIDGEEYTVVRGELQNYLGDRGYTYDQGLECLVDNKSGKKSMWDFRDKKVKILSLNNSLEALRDIDEFDKRYNKARQTGEITKFSKILIDNPNRSEFERKVGMLEEEINERKPSLIERFLDGVGIRVI